MSHRDVHVVTRGRRVVANCSGEEYSMGDTPESLVEFAAALEQIANWAFARGRFLAANEYAAKEDQRVRENEILVGRIRALVGSARGGAS